MWLDKTLRMSEDQAVTATAVSSTVIDLGADHEDLGTGLDVFIECRIGADFATNDSIQASLQDSANDSSFADIIAGPVVLVADAIEGKRLLGTLVPIGHRRYLRMNYTVAGSNASAGTVDAHIVNDMQTNS